MATLEDAIRKAKAAIKPEVQAHVGGAGERTSINGHEIMALWENAQAERVQTFLDEGEWHKGAYIVSLPIRALQSPWNVKNGCSVVRVERSAPGVVRDLVPEGQHKVIALVVMSAPAV